MTITNCIKWLLADSDRFVLTSDIPSDQIAIFTDNLFFNWQKEVAKCAEAIRQVLKAEGKSYFIIACHSTFIMDDMRYIIESGLGRIAGHAFVDSKTIWEGKLRNEGAAVIFKIV